MNGQELETANINKPGSVVEVDKMPKTHAETAAVLTPKPKAPPKPKPEQFLVITKEQLSALQKGEGVKLDIGKKIQRTLTTVPESERKLVALKKKYEADRAILEGRA